MDRITKALELARAQRVPVQAAPEVGQCLPAKSGKRTRRVEVSADILRRNRIVVDDMGPQADAYRLLRTRVLRRMKQNGWTALGVTSASPGDGKTLTTINLGIAMSRDPNYTVLLVDADLRRPSMADRFGLQLEVGLGEYLHSECALEDTLLNPGIEDLVLIPCKGFVSRSSELLSTPRMAELVDELKSRYPARIVVFDLPPVLVADDVVAFSGLVDALLLVVEDGKTREDDLQHAYELLEGVELIGSVLNKAEQTSRGYDQYY